MTNNGLAFSRGATSNWFSTRGFIIVYIYIYIYIRLRIKELGGLYLNSRPAVATALWHDGHNRLQ